MKPLSEWEHDKLWKRLLCVAYSPSEGVDVETVIREIVAELLCRERERCAKEADAVIKERGEAVERMSGTDLYRLVNQGGWQAAHQIADAIRGLK